MFERTFLLGIISAALITSCSCSENGTKNSGEKRDNQEKVAEADVMQRDVGNSSAIAILNPIEGSLVKGKVTFTKTAEGVKVTADVEGLKPGKHGFHIHEHGSCGGKGAADAGPHFNPTKKNHGGPDDEDRHVGDLGNLEADKNGHAHYERVDRAISLEGENTIVGRSIVIHSDEDDFKTQPTGHSGDRLACGVIEKLN